MRSAPVLALVLATSAALLVPASPTRAATHAPRAFPKRVGGPVVTFSESAIAAHGATPRGTIYFAGVTLGAGSYVIHVERSAGSATADAEGNAALPADIDTRSVWLVADAATGGYTVAAPEGMVLREIDLPGRADENADGQVHRLLLDRYAVDVFLLRPGEGIWSSYFRDGDAADADQAVNGRTDAAFDALQPVGAAPAHPDRFKPGDLLFIVDRNTLEFHVTKRGN